MLHLNGYGVTGRGFIWGTSAKSLTNELDAGDGYGGFTATLGSLSAGTTYYFAAYATNSQGTADGSVLSFTTAPAPQTAKTAQATSKTFSDVPSSYWAYGDMSELAAMGCITGYPDGTFRPDNDITRAEFTTMLVRALRLTPKTGHVFADTEGIWAQGYISTAAADGVVKGYDSSDFGPNDPITREQMTAMVVRAAKLEIVSGKPSFKDAAQIDAWARADVVTAVKDGTMKGYPDGTFRPLAHATWAEAVTVIAGILIIPHSNHAPNVAAISNVRKTVAAIVPGRPAQSVTGRCAGG